MAKAFSSFTGADTGLIENALNGLSGEAGSLLPRQIYTGAAPTIDDVYIGEVASLVQSRFNLDASEAARRILLDQFLLCALKRSSNQHAIVTAEHSIGNDQRRLGCGRLDYLISSIEKNGPPIVMPNLIVEAKKDDRTYDDGLWQLLAEMVTAAQLAFTRLDDYPLLLRGVLTNGQSWTFVELYTRTVHTADHQAKGYRLVTTPDTSIGNEQALNPQNIAAVLGCLKAFIDGYSAQKNGPLLA